MKNIIKRLLRVLARIAFFLLYVVGGILGFFGIATSTVVFIALVAPVWYILTGKNTIDWWFDRLEDIGEWWRKITDKL